MRLIALTLFTSLGLKNRIDTRGWEWVMEKAYIVIGWLVGIVTFFGIWIYAFASWGLLIGLAIGWLPALIGGAIAGFLWPLGAIALIGLIVFVAIFH